MRAAWAEFRRASDRRWLLGACLLSVFGALVFWRNTISEHLVPDPRMNRQLERAQAALDNGELSTADGSGARELFESVLATDPDQMTARQGLIAVRNAAIVRTQLALDQHRLLQAKKNLALAQALSAPEVQLQPLRARLHDLDSASSDTPGLLAKAAMPETTDEAELALLNQVLRLDADNVAALEARRALLARWLARAEELLAARQVHGAERIVEQVIAADPAHLDLPPAQAKLGEALVRLQRERVRTLELAAADARAGRIDRAADRYLQLARAGDNSAVVQEALHRLAAQMALQAQRQAADFQFRRAQASLQKAKSWSPQAAAILVAERRVEQSRLTQKRLLRSPASSDRERLPLLISEAEQAMVRGDYITPPGTSAWDKLRVASALAPDSSQVLKLQREFAKLSRACFEQAMSDGQLKRAQSCLEASLTVDPASASATQARHRLAERWLAFADERIGASDYPEAEKAVVSARHWQPRHPLLKATAARLRRARGASR